MNRHDSREDGALTLVPIARIHTDFPDKFGVPRQSGLCPALTAQLVFEEKFRRPEAVRGLEQFSHIWLIWEFSRALREDWSPTVRPPRLGGNRRIGVFATRSPFRPNALGLSCVRLEKVETDTPHGPVLTVSGADLTDGTPIYDIKPYLPFVDSHPEAAGSYTDQTRTHLLSVSFAPGVLDRVPPEKQEALCQILAQDPRPSYQDDPARVYGVSFAGLEVKFRVEGDRLTVEEISESGIKNAK